MLSAKQSDPAGSVGRGVDGEFAEVSFLGRIASAQLLMGDKNAASENFSPSSSHCAIESKMPTCPSLLLWLLC